MVKNIHLIRWIVGYALGIASLIDDAQYSIEQLILIVVQYLKFLSVPSVVYTPRNCPCVVNKQSIKKP